jgi:hexosaminidase
MVADYPRFSYRGFMLDSVRHFHPVSLIKKLVDGMEANKLNVLHWHITDDQAFPYQSKVFPELRYIILST